MSHDSITNAEMSTLHTDMQRELAKAMSERMDAVCYAAMAGRAIQGKTATMTVIDDVYNDDWLSPEEKYEVAEQRVAEAVAHINTARRKLDDLHYDRYASPYHPMKFVRWCQKRTLGFWVWTAVLPILLGLLYAVCAELYENFGWIPALITFWSASVGTIIAMKHCK